MKVDIKNYRKGAGERRINVAIDEWDTYSADHTLAQIVLPLLLQLKDSKMGVPNSFTGYVGHDFDSNYCFEFVKKDENAVFDKCCKEWDDVLDKIIWAFQQIVCDNYDDAYHHGEFEFSWEKTDPILNPATGAMEEMSVIVDKNPDGHWYDYVGHQLHEERINEGLRLFGTYYRDLWS